MITSSWKMATMTESNSLWCCNHRKKGIDEVFLGYRFFSSSTSNRSKWVFGKTTWILKRTLEEKSGIQRGIENVQFSFPVDWVFSLRYLLAATWVCRRRTLSQSSASVSWQIHPGKCSLTQQQWKCCPFSSSGHRTAEGRDWTRGGCSYISLLACWLLAHPFGLDIDPSSASRAGLTLGLAVVGECRVASCSFAFKLRGAESVDAGGRSLSTSDYGDGYLAGLSLEHNWIVNTRALFTRGCLVELFALKTWELCFSDISQAPFVAWCLLILDQYFLGL